jgi:16S rRNA C967 or C1407 C5-methylase (RsmB/RsmF family)
MKKINLLLVVMLMLTASCFAQTQKAAWPEMKNFHKYMSTTFHPAEEGNLAPLKAKADSLYYAAKAWMGSPIPSNFKADETTAALKKLNVQCNDIWAAVQGGKTSDEKLKEMITEAHDTFHKIAGECRKADD